MNGFLGALRKIGHVALEIDMVAAPVVGVFNPVAGQLMAMAARGALKAESAFPGDGRGPEKADLARQQFDIDLGNELSAGILAARGETVTYDPVKWKAMNDAQVALYNAVAELKATLGTEKKA